MTNKLNATINLDKYYGRLQEKLVGHTTDLAVVLRSLEDASYQEKAGAQDPSRPQIVHNPPMALDKGAAERQTSKCFSALIDSFMAFVDEMIAIRELGNGPIEITRELSGEQAITEYVESTIQTAINRIRHDVSRKAPVKIASFGLTADDDRIARQFVNLRNCLAHHDQRAKENLVLEYAKLTILVDGSEMPPMPCILNAGQTISANIELAEKNFPKDSRVSFNEDECTRVSFTIETRLATAILQSMKQGSNATSPSAVDAPLSP